MNPTLLKIAEDGVSRLHNQLLLADSKIYCAKEKKFCLALASPTVQVTEWPSLFMVGSVM